MKNNDTIDMNKKKDRDIKGITSTLIDAPSFGAVSVGSSWERRHQTLAMFTCSLYFIMPMVLFCWMLVAILLMSSVSSRWTAAPVACYISYAFLIDKAPLTGTRRPWLRYTFPTWWNRACDYLPILLVKTADLDPTKKYVLGYHPHGIISVGCFCAFATDGARTLSLVKEPPAPPPPPPAVLSKEKKSKPTQEQNDTTAPTEDDDNASCAIKNSNHRGFSTLFPGIDRRVITLPQNFATPFLREYFLSMGALNSAKETFRSVLARDGTALVVVVGGAAESMLVQNRSIDLVLESRKGFVREAIRANACLVPVIGFGESDLYTVYHPKKDENGNIPWIGRLQVFVKRTTGIAMPLFQGRSIFLKNIGVMPQRTPVCVVVGAPIEPPPASYWKGVKGDDQPPRSTTSFAPLVDREVDKPLNRDGEILYEWHAKYMKALKELHHTHEDAKWNVPGQKRRGSLTIVK